MKQCDNGHFYDEKRFESCPYCQECAGVGKTAAAGSVGKTVAAVPGAAALQADVALVDDDTVSRESHALVTYDVKHNSFSLSPGQSRGITYCNDEQVEMVRPLNAYDVIEVGKSQLLFLPLCGEKFQWNEE